MTYEDIRAAVAASRHRTYIADRFRAAVGLPALEDAPQRSERRKREAQEDLREYAQLMRQRIGALDRM